MASLSEIRQERLKKIDILKKAGMDPYPSSVPHTHLIKEVKSDFEKLEKSGDEVSLSGRVMAIRGQGAIRFFVIKDDNEEFQVVVKKDEIKEEKFDLLYDTADIGDFISFTGNLFVTQRGENSLLAKDWQMASKSLLPLPEKWHGLQDIETKYRQRYLEIISDSEAFQRYEIRSKIIKDIRQYLDSKHLLEVETPILQSQTGGAMAKVFETHHNALDQKMVLRIALEIDHKILMTAGYNGVYEIGKCFRNEGMDSSHIQEFTMLEWYAAYKTLDDNISWTEEMIRNIALNNFNKSVFKVYDKDDNEHEVDFSKPFEQVRFDELLERDANIDAKKASIEEIRSKAIEVGVDQKEVEGTGRGNLLDAIYKKTSRGKIIQPTFVTNYPQELKPLAKPTGDGTSIVAQLVIAGSEITNMYGELIDPVVQRDLLEHQSEAKAKGDEEAMEVDNRFLTAMEHGMPPMTGFGMGIDRFCAILLEEKNIRDTIFFPLVKNE
ncbi:lysine--tRNA ligase [Candidatus Nomurabacteria bacterium]|nr:lysine--tRNA ligase [Candidatus Nomurabacteria bacterium]